MSIMSIEYLKSNFGKVVWLTGKLKRVKPDSYHHTLEVFQTENASGLIRLNSRILCHIDVDLETDTEVEIRGILEEVKDEIFLAELKEITLIKASEQFIDICGGSIIEKYKVGSQVTEFSPEDVEDLEAGILHFFFVNEWNCNIRESKLEIKDFHPSLVSTTDYLVRVSDSFSVTPFYNKETDFKFQIVTDVPHSSYGTYVVINDTIFNCIMQHRVGVFYSGGYGDIELELVGKLHQIEINSKIYPCIHDIESCFISRTTAEGYRE